jgi:hypothetical protein
MKMVMNFLQAKVVERSKFEDEITMESVDRMYKAVVDCFDIHDRDAQKRWMSVVHAIRGKKVT